MKKFALIAAAAAFVASANAAVVDLATIDHTNFSHSWDGTSAFKVFSTTGTSTGKFVNLQNSDSTDIDWGTDGTSTASFDLTVSNIGANTADGVGTFSFTDVNGTVIAGTLSGDFSLINNVIFFNGSGLVTSGLADGSTFEGTDGNAVATDFDPPFPPPYFAFSTNLATNAPNFFGAAFTSGLSGGDTRLQAVPVPAAAGLGFLGLGLVGWMKRRLA